MKLIEKYGPTKYIYNNGYHKIGMPAYISYKTIDKVWLFNNKWHKINGQYYNYYSTFYRHALYNHEITINVSKLVI